jgi:hypothetical protein
MAGARLTEMSLGIDGDHQAVAGSLAGPGPEPFGDSFGFVQREVEPSARAVSAGVLRDAVAMTSSV